MSAAAAWSYTARATWWPRTGRDDWTGAPTWGAPRPVGCDYSTEIKIRRAANGDEFGTSLILYTEEANIKLGDRIKLGASTAADPIADGALEVRSVVRQADTFDRLADDYEVAA
jgi:hypothetical protein